MKLLIGLARNTIDPVLTPKVLQFLQLWHWHSLKGEGVIEATMAQRLVITMFRELPPESPARRLSMPSVYAAVPVDAQQFQALHLGFDPHFKFADRWLGASSFDPTQDPQTYKALHMQSQDNTASRLVVFRVPSSALKNTLSLTVLAELYGTPNHVTAGDFKRYGDVVLDTTEASFRKQLISANIVATIERT